MRISDWSSDVCSSDLRADVGGGLGQDVALGRPRDLGAEEGEQPEHVGPRIEVHADIDRDEVDAAPRVAVDHAEIDPRLQRRSEESRVGEECFSTCRYRWVTDN